MLMQKLKSGIEEEDEVVQPVTAAQSGWLRFHGGGAVTVACCKCPAARLPVRWLIALAAAMTIAGFAVLFVQRYQGAPCQRLSSCVADVS